MKKIFVSTRNNDGVREFLATDGGITRYFDCAAVYENEEVQRVISIWKEAGILERWQVKEVRLVDPETNF